MSNGMVSSYSVYFETLEYYLLCKVECMPLQYGKVCWHVQRYIIKHCTNPHLFCMLYFTAATRVSFFFLLLYNTLVCLRLQCPCKVEVLVLFWYHLLHKRIKQTNYLEQYWIFSNVVRFSKENKLTLDIGGICPIIY